MENNPRNFVYPQGTTVELPGYFLTDIIMLMDQLVKDEIKVQSGFKYNYVNEKNKVIKTPKKEDLESGKVKKVVDFDRTVLNPTLEYHISEKGLAYAELKNFLEGLHYKNIQEGKAVNYQELAKGLENTVNADNTKD